MHESIKDIQFKDYFEDRKIGVHSSDFYVIIPKKYVEPNPIFCSICDCALATSEDQTTQEKLGCCTHCRDNFYYQNKDEWDNGWRPEKKKDCNHVKTLIVR